MLKTISISELIAQTSRGCMIGIYGLPDAGKSTFCVTASQFLKILYIDSEQKFGKIWNNVPKKHRNEGNIESVEVVTLQDLIAVTSDPAIKKYDAIVVDSITSLVDREIQDIYFRQKRKATFDDWRELGTNFIQSVENLKNNGIAMFFIIQAEEKNGRLEPDTQGSLIPKKVREACDGLFYIRKNEDGRELVLKNNDTECMTKSKFVPSDHKDILKGDEVCFESLWEMYPSKPVEKPKPKAATKKQIADVKKLLADVEFARGEPVDEKVFLDAAEIPAESVETMSAEDCVKAISILNDKLESLKKKK